MVPTLKLQPPSFFGKSYDVTPPPLPESWRSDSEDEAVSLF
jgi:hypothetical protein